MKYIDYLSLFKSKAARFHPRGKGGILDINGERYSDDYESVEVTMFDVMNDFVVLKEKHKKKIYAIYYTNLTVVETE